MSTYAIGDIHGCLESLKGLLHYINFNENKDKLWFTGDLINRGPKSLETLKFLYEMQDIIQVVLGNHDISLLILDEDKDIKIQHNCHDILTSKKKHIYFSWLKKQSFFHYDKELDYCMVHAGIIPQWDLNTAMLLNNEVAEYLKSKSKYKKLITNLFGNKPIKWDPELNGMNRIRFIVNVFTRLRFCSSDGEIELKTKGNKIHDNRKFKPWFLIKKRKAENENIIFGHWASLMGKTNQDKIFALDTGCVWGGKLTALRLEDKKMYAISSKEKSLQ